MTLRTQYGWLLDSVIACHGFSAKRLLGRSRQPALCRARHDLWRRLRTMGLSYPAIGRLVKRDHTTVLCALNPATRESKRRAYERACMRAAE